MTRQVITATALALLLACTSSAMAQYAPVFDQASLNGSNGFRIDGKREGAALGWDVARAGDVNGDGYADILLSAPATANNSDKIRGEVAVIFGKPGGHVNPFNPATLDGNNGFRVVGFEKDQIGGLKVAGAGDVNGDGFDDIVIGNREADIGTKLSAGMAILVFGRKSGFKAKLHISDLNGRSGVRLDGVVAGDKLGNAVAGAGDINDDGFDDVILGAPGFDPGLSLEDAGAAYVIYGRRTDFPKKLPLNLLGATGVSRINGVKKGGELGYDVASAGDFNKDGFTDLAVAAPSSNGVGVEHVGQISVVYGSDRRLDAVFSVSDIDGMNGHSIESSSSDQFLGFSLAAAGDVNGDGYGDLVAGSNGAFSDGSFPNGAAHVLFGNPSFPKDNLLANLISAGLAKSFVGLGSFSGTGASVSGGSDINGDGYDDIVIGAPRLTYDETRPSAGAAFVVFGHPYSYPNGITLGNLDGLTGFRINGSETDGGLGYASAILGDTNHDGFAELAIGAPFEKPSGRSAAGSVYIIKGLAPEKGIVRTGADSDAVILGGKKDDELLGGFGNDWLEGREGGDKLDGGFGGNTASYEHARGPVTASLTNAAVNTGEAAGDSYYNIVGLRGSWHADRLIGDAGPNGIAGLRGRDVMSGGGGVTTYFYFDVRDSRNGAKRRDVITDFNPGTPATTVDRIQLYTLDAKAGVNGHQYFKWIGTRKFSGRKGELRVGRVKGKVLAQADVTGDGKADFEVHFANLKSARNLDLGDFLVRPGP